MAVSGRRVKVKKGKGHPRTGHESLEGARWGWVVNATLWPIYLRERPGTHFIGPWVGPTAGLDWCGKSRPPPWIRSPDRPTPIESPYRLNYASPRGCTVLKGNQYLNMNLNMVVKIWDGSWVIECTDRKPICGSVYCGRRWEAMAFMLVGRTAGVTGLYRTFCDGISSMFWQDAPHNSFIFSVSVFVLCCFY